jgi:hypothetical protein
MGISMSSSYVATIVKLFETCRYKHDLYAVFSDWGQCAAIWLSNAVDLPKRDEREKQYLEVVRRYDPATLKVFPEILGAVVMALEEKPTDILGQVFHALELHNTARGQFFTPYSICEMMAKINIGPDDDIAAVMKGRGYIVRRNRPGPPSTNVQLCCCFAGNQRMPSTVDIWRALVDAAPASQLSG